MSPERWRQINTLFQAAQERAPADRAAFLATACADDEELRHRVEAMFAIAEPPALLPPPPALVAPLNPEPTTLPTGRLIRDYLIVRELGRGGMGEVYLAEDTRLGRHVALKLLPAHYTQDAERVRRFQREARTASALNHPNIVTIYDFGQQGARHFIAAEFVEGQTLRGVFKQRELKLAQALDVAAQVASALAAAHSAGIVHRDIKPENVMLRPDGYVKVLDFGLAKLIETAMTTHAPGAEADSFQTLPGKVMGTASYMSPEQARGLEVDARADIFSLGVVVYEMLSGRRPFEGVTQNDVLAALIEREPTPLTKYLPSAPPELLQVVSRMLAKKLEDRYQTAGELVTELKSLKDELAVIAQLDRIKTTSGAELSGATNASAATNTGGRAQTTAPTVASTFARRRSLLMISALALIIVLALGSWLWFSRRATSAPAFAQIRMTKFTATGNTLGGAISPDGKYVAYIAAEAAGAGVWIKQVVGGGQVPIVSPQARARTVAFAPDGNQLYYTADDAQERGAVALYQVPTLGGPPRKVLSRAGSVSNGSFAPDGQRIAFVRGQSLIIARLDGGGEQTLTAVPAENELRSCAWSRDGSTIAYVARERHKPDTSFFYVATKPATGGAERIITQRRQSIRNIAWLPAGQGLLMVAVDDALIVPQVYHLAYPDGRLRNITQDINDYSGLSVTADGAAALVTQNDRPATIWVAPLNDLRQARQLTPGASGYDSLAWTPDGKLVYSHEVNGRDDLWLTSVADGQPTQLTNEAGNNYYPAVAPDGRHLAFVSSRAGDTHLWRMDIDGNNAVQLTKAAATQPQFSPDGQWIIYKDGAGGRGQLWQVASQGGQPVRLTEHEADKAALSPDGQWLAYQYNDPETKRTRIAVRSLAGGAPSKSFDARAVRGLIRWRADGQALAYIASDREIKLQPLNGGAPQILLNSPADLFFWFDFSRDGRQLAYTTGRRTQDLILINSQ